MAVMINSEARMSSMAVRDMGRVVRSPGNSGGMALAVVPARWRSDARTDRCQSAAHPRRGWLLHLFLRRNDLFR